MCVYLCAEHVRWMLGLLRNGGYRVIVGNCDRYDAHQIVFRVANAACGGIRDIPAVLWASSYAYST
jgi:hypothetical protein